MTDGLLHGALSNLLVSLILALVAWTVQARGARPRLAHLLWLVVLAKLVTPPLWMLPVVPVASWSAVASIDTLQVAAAEAPVAAVDPGGLPAMGGVRAAELAPAAATATDIVLLLWLLGSTAILVWSTLRILRFHRLLGQASEPAPAELQGVVGEVARRMGLHRVPVLHLASARLSPMVWWVGGRVRIYVPEALLETLDPQALRMVLGHELAHVRRRDHWVRWLEWMACVAFWWNPVAWWARHNLRAHEEECCDSMVLERLTPGAQPYANSLLTVAEFLSTPVLRPPALASEINGGGCLERRFHMILSSSDRSPLSRRVQGVVVGLSLGLLPLGVVYAQAPDFEAVGSRLVQAVSQGELSRAQAVEMIEALARARLEERMAEARITRGGAGVAVGSTAGGKTGALARAFGGVGISRVEFARLRDMLADNGVPSEKLDLAMSGTLRLVEELLKHQRADLDPKMKQYLAGEVGLDGDQVGLIHRLALRIAKISKGAQGEGRYGAREVADNEPEPGSGKVSRESDLEQFASELAAAVRAGLMTKKEASSRYERARAAAATAGAGPMSLGEYTLRMNRAVESGRLSAGDAEKTVTEYRAVLKERGRPSVDVDRLLQDFKRKLDAELTAGKITRQEAVERFELARQKARAAAQERPGGAVRLK